MLLGYNAEGTETKIFVCVLLVVKILIIDYRSWEID